MIAAVDKQISGKFSITWIHHLLSFLITLWCVNAYYYDDYFLNVDVAKEYYSPGESITIEWEANLAHDEVFITFCGAWDCDDGFLITSGVPASDGTFSYTLSGDLDNGDYRICVFELLDGPDKYSDWWYTYDGDTSWWYTYDGDTSHGYFYEGSDCVRFRVSDSFTQVTSILQPPENAFEYELGKDSGCFYFFEGFCYGISDPMDKRDFWDADAACTAAGATLASIPSPAVDRNLALLIERHLENGQSYWIGLTDADEEGVWKWLDSTEYSYINWWLDCELWCYYYTAHWDSEDDDFQACLDECATTEYYYYTTDTENFDSDLFPDSLGYYTTHMLDCAMLGYGGWKIASCGEQHPFICKWQSSEMSTTGNDYVETEGETGVDSDQTLGSESGASTELVSKLLLVFAIAGGIITLSGF